MTKITPAKFIRVVILDMKQKEVAEVLGVSQVMVSKIEDAEQVNEGYRSGYRALARSKGIKLDDKWFTKVPVDAKVRRATADK